jgi:hypothetical protein
VTVWLRALGVAVLALGLGVGGWAGTRAAGDVDFAQKRDAYERHQDHPIFQAEYYAAASRHYGMVAGAVAATVGGLVFGSMLLALATIVARLPGRDEETETQKAG